MRTLCLIMPFCFVLFLSETFKRVSVYLCISMFYENFLRKKKKQKQPTQAYVRVYSTSIKYYASLLKVRPTNKQTAGPTN